MQRLFALILVASFMVWHLPMHAQLIKSKSKDDQSKQDPKKPKDKGIKPYAEVITKTAVSDSGLIHVHRVGGKHYFEIPNDLLEREILVVSRISGFVKNLNFGGAGVKSRPQQVIRWQRLNDRLLLRSVSYNSVASEEKPIYESVRNNNFEPVIMAFDIEAYNADTSACVIRIDPLFTTDVSLIGAVSPNQRKNFGITGLDGKRSLISRMKSYPQNVEIRHILTYRGGNKLPDNQLTGTLSVEMNQSFIVLPERPMQARLYDARVGYFSIRQTDYGLDEQRAATRRYITRWRLEPKDPEAYARGELVEPVKPIVYYVDPATPEKWRPYIKQGVNDWQPAFEKAGFKNAIYAADPPSKEEDPDWTPEDVRYSVIRYVSTDIQNAQGPHVHDPRTGEILESDIIWYHNVMNLLRNWFFVQTAAINPDARGVRFRDEIMGRLIRFVSAHEVGHTLGLPHNMGSSSAYAVDSLRSVSFTQKMGTAPSIMDYARFNYVAQPEDGPVGLMPSIGPYDEWSIIYGYKRIPGIESAEDERQTLNQWIVERAGDPLYRFGRQRGLPLDPSAQTEDLGDDAMRASAYGIRNLKRIVPHLIEWTAEDAKDYADLDELYNQVVNQLRRYIGHVIANVGGVYEVYKTYDEDDVVYKYVDRATQERALAFLAEHLFQTPEWLTHEDILRRFEPEGQMQRIQRLQDRSLDLLFIPDRLKRLIEQESLQGQNAFSCFDLFEQTRRAIFSELRSRATSDGYRRNLQRTYIKKMQDLMQLEGDVYALSDIQTYARATLMALQSDLSAYPAGDALMRAHYADMQARIESILDPN